MVQINIDMNPFRDGSLRAQRSSVNTSPMRFNMLDNRTPPRVVLTSDTPDFDPAVLKQWKEEGFAVAYLPNDGEDASAYRNSVRRLVNPLGVGEKFSIVAYGEAASLCLQLVQKPVEKLAAVIAYYPTWLPKNDIFPASIDVQIHIAGDQNLDPPYHVYNYPAAKEGFAETDIDEYDRISADLAWSRALELVRRSMSHHVELEDVWERNLTAKFVDRDLHATMATMTKRPTVNFVPTMTGGVNRQDLKRFYSEFFRSPPSLHMRLLSRTIGADHIVDETHIAFKHTQEVPWLLPGVPPTDKAVEVALVSVVAIRGGRISMENMYWDQASVLMQVGLLDPKYVPKSFKSTTGETVERLPVVGRNGARKVADPKAIAGNELIAEWWEDDSEDEEREPEKVHPEVEEPESEVPTTPTPKKNGKQAPKKLQKDESPEKEDSKVNEKQEEEAPEAKKDEEPAEDEAGTQNAE